MTGVMKNKVSLKAGQQAFSLVELLVVIAVIAIIAAIAIPNIANITAQATIAKDQRNAQNIASVASAAKAAGVTNDLHLKADVIAALEGNTLTSPTGMKFGISSLSTAEETGALVYLTDGSDAEGAVLYVPSTN
jgi:type IV pilus assembly protein PilA